MEKIRVIITNNQKAVKVPTGVRMLIRRCCHAVLRMEKFEDSAEISVTFVDNEQIRELNAQYRNKDAATDVLSFPMGENGVYDNENGGMERVRMREKEEYVMSQLGLPGTSSYTV